MAEADAVAERLRRAEIEIARLQEVIASERAALRLQAKEYQRRLDTLNHAHEKAIEVQHTYVTQEKYEDRMEAEELARKIALTRIDERMEDFITRYEIRQREIDATLTTQKASAETATRIAEEQYQKSTLVAQDLQRKTNRNMALGGITVTIVISIANGVGPF